MAEPLHDRQCDMVFDALVPGFIAGRLSGTNFRCTRRGSNTVERRCLDTSCQRYHVFHFCDRCYEMVRD